MLEFLDWKKLTVNAAIGYVSSWLLFFILLKPFMAVFGKLKGGALNYGFSWLTWIGITWALQVYNPQGDILDARV